MNFDDVTAIQIPEGNVKSIAIGGVTVWEAPVVDKYTWDAVFASIDNGTYATEYAIGDMVPLDLGDEGLINMQIAAFDTDDLADGSGKAPITWIANELLATNHRMNPKLVTNDDGTYQEGTGAIGGWENCEMRAYLKETIKPMIPINVRNNITVIKKTQIFNTTRHPWDAQQQITEEDVWIPSSDEFGEVYTSLFPDKASRVKTLSGSSTQYSYFTRDSTTSNTFTIISTSGDYDTSGAPQNRSGVCLCFCT